MLIDQSNFGFYISSTERLSSWRNENYNKNAHNRSISNIGQIKIIQITKF